MTGGSLSQTEQVVPSLTCLLFRALWARPLGITPPFSSLRRELYSQFLREMIIQPGIAKANMGVSREDVTFEDHVSRGQQQGLGLQGGEGRGL